MTEEATEIAAEEAEDEEITGIYEYDATEMRDILAERLTKRAEELETDANIESGLGAANRYKVATFRWGAEELRNLATHFRVAQTEVVRTFKRSEIGDPGDFDDDIDEVRIDEALAADLARVMATLEEAQAALEKANSALAAKDERITALEAKIMQFSPAVGQPLPTPPTTGGMMFPTSTGILTGDQTTVK